MAKLTILEEGEELVYEIFDDEVTIGRGGSNEIQLADSAASKRHAVVRRLQGHLKFVDLESSNGSLVNGRFQNQRWLRDGDRLRIGQAEILIATERDPEGPPVVKAVKPSMAKPVAAKPAAAKPAAAKPAPAQPAPPRPAAPAAAPVAAAAAAAAPSRAAPSRAAPSRARSRDDYDDYDDEDHGDRRPTRRAKKDNSLLIGLGILVGLLVFGWLVLSFFGGTTSGNRGVLHEGLALAREYKYGEALRYAEQNGDPYDDYYDLLKSGMADWRAGLRAQQMNVLAKEAHDFWDYQIFRKSVNPRVTPKGAMTEDQTVERITGWLKKYPDTPAVRTFLGSNEDYYQHYRLLLRERTGTAYGVNAAWDEINPRIRDLRNKGDHPDAHQALSTYVEITRFLMSSENWRLFKQQADDELRSLKSAAQGNFDPQFSQVKSLLDAGDRKEAVSLLKGLVRRYAPLPDIVGEARALLRNLNED